MHKTWATACIILTCCPTLFAQDPGRKPNGSPEHPPFPVEMEVSASKRDADGNQKVLVTLTIKKGHYIFAHELGIEDLLPSRTTMTVTGKHAPKKVIISYPKGKVVKDQVLGDYWIYTGKTVLEAAVTRASGDTEPILVTVRVHPFNDRVCNWLPTSLKKSVK